ncbi:MAG: NFACT family protein [Clostridia bacterium]|nr:NFACT family protein [Clostridia bacterium]
MPFDAGVMAAVVSELKKTVIGARVDKIYQPERDEIILGIRTSGENRKLLLSASAGASRVSFITAERENPMQPPMFCMLLRKHLSGAHILNVRQIGFDRAVEIKLTSADEMGYSSVKYLVCEIMGTYSNVIFLDENRRIMAVLHPISLSATNKRQVLCGFEYENPPRQDGKTEALCVDRYTFIEKMKQDVENGRNGAADKYLIANYSGLSPLVAREIVYRATKNTSTPLGECDAEKLWFYFDSIYGNVKQEKFDPCLVGDVKGKVIDFSFCEIRQYGTGVSVKKYEQISSLLDDFYCEKDKQERIKHRGQDILRLLTNASSRITKKTALQKQSLKDCENKENFKRFGDLITANIYMLKKGMTKVELVDYYDQTMPTVTVLLDERYTPAQNAQQYYKRYNKAKSAEIMLAKQIEESEKEIAYIDTIFDSLTKAETEADLSQIRTELSVAGYGKTLDNLRRAMTKNKKEYKNALKKEYKPMKFITSGGYEVLCGKNNLHNDYITTELASKDDYWFHIKNAPGSHVVMRCGKDEPPAEDFTQCAMIAAYYSSQKELPQAPVDYTRVRNVKKPQGSKPGFVIYETNYTCYVTADGEEVERLKIK